LTRPVRVLTPALADVAAGRDWYDSKRQGLGDAFVEEFDKAIKRIATIPGFTRKLFRMPAGRGWSDAHIPSTTWCSPTRASS